MMRRGTKFEMQGGALRWVLMVLALLLVGALAALWMFPARKAVEWAGSRLAPLQLEQVEGRVWDGQAGKASVYGQSLGRLRWQASPLSLIGMDREVGLWLDGGPLNAELHLIQQSATSLMMQRSKFGVDAARLSPFLDVPALKFSGEVEINIDHARIDGSWPSEVKGRAVWQKAAVSGSAQALLGDLQADFASVADGSIEGRLSDRGGPLVLKGDFHVGLDGYRANATLSTRDGNAAVAEALRYIGEPQADGSVRFALTGQLMGSGR